MSESQRHLFITGAGGRLGQALLGQLIEQGWMVRALWHPSAGPLPENPKHGKLQWVEGDVLDEFKLRSQMQGCQSVLHMAGLILSRDPRDLYRVNTQGTARVVQACEAVGVDHFVQVSSISVDYPVRTPYAQSKWMAEQVVQNSQINWTIVRPTLLVGQGGGAEYRLFAKLCRLPIVALPQGGKALKRPVHVNDLATGLCQLLSSGSISYQKTYSLAGLETLSLAQMLQLMKSELVHHQMSQQKIISFPSILAQGIAAVLDFFPVAHFSWKQALAGLLQDANPDIHNAQNDFSYNPLTLQGRWWM